LGHALRLARRLDLAAMTPQDDLASTKYCLADPAKADAVYIPTAGNVKVSLGQAENRFAVEWIHPSTGKAVGGDAVTGGADHEFAAPFDGDAVLYLSCA
jgi:hypothetical protein